MFYFSKKYISATIYIKKTLTSSTFGPASSYLNLDGFRREMG